MKYRPRAQRQVPLKGDGKSYSYYKYRPRAQRHTFRWTIYQFSLPMGQGRSTHFYWHCAVDHSWGHQHIPLETIFTHVLWIGRSNAMILLERTLRVITHHTTRADQFTLLALTVSVYTQHCMHNVPRDTAVASRLTCTPTRRCIAAVVGLRVQYVVALQENGRDGNDHSVHELPAHGLLRRTCSRLSPVPSQKRRDNSCTSLRSNAVHDRGSELRAPL